MRTPFKRQMMFGEVDISEIKFNPKSRDDIPKLLRGLQYIWTDRNLLESVFEVLKKVLPKRNGIKLSSEQRSQKASTHFGRPGMEQWKILVLGVLRLGINADYDRIHELANHHDLIRQMLGHGDWSDKSEYQLQTIKDNLRLFTPDILDEINQLVVNAGHQLLKKKEKNTVPELLINEDSASTSSKLYVCCDSFVLKTDVHYPTDLNLVFDSIRKTIENCHYLSKEYGITIWQQADFCIRKLKQQHRKATKLKHSASKDKTKKKKRDKEILKAQKRYLDLAEQYLERAESTRKQLQVQMANSFEMQSLSYFMTYSYYIIDQAKRRILGNQTISHDEKIFSVFQPHTEWINKGKAGVPVELGKRVCICKDQHGFILHHQVLENRTDDQITVEFIKKTKNRFQNIYSASFDKGFYSPENQRQLNELVDLVVMPKKGKLSKEDIKREYSPEFKDLRRKHSAVESSINELEVHGLDKCPDHGIQGFKRYVALGVLASNIHHLGGILQKQEKEKLKMKRGHYKKAA